MQCILTSDIVISMIVRLVVGIVDLDVGEAFMVTSHFNGFWLIVWRALGSSTD